MDDREKFKEIALNEIEDVIDADSIHAERVCKDLKSKF